MTTPEEQERLLVEQAKHDPKAFGDLFERHFDQIFRYVMRRTGNVQVAEDITAEVFYKALDKLWQFKWRSVPFSAWLYRIATNEVNAYYRQSSRRALSLDQYEEDHKEALEWSNLKEEILEAERVIENERTYKEVQKAIVQLPIKYQEVITLRFFEEKKLQEISTILNKKEGTIKSLLSRGLKRLQQELEGQAHVSTQPSTPLRIIESKGRETIQ